MVSIEEIVLPEKANVNHLPKAKDLTLSILLLEQRKSHNSIIDILQVIVSEVKELKAQGNGNHRLLTNIENRIIPEVQQTLTDNLNALETKQGDLQAHGFRQNLICRGKFEVIVDDKPETPQQSEQQFKDILRNDLGIEHADSIMFRAVHRLPKPKNGRGSTQPKPLIAAFLKQSDRDLVLSKANLLKGKGISLQSHLPKKLNDLRNDMLKERRRLLNADESRQIRVVDKNFQPVMQEKLQGDQKWTTLNFVKSENAGPTVNPRRSGRRRPTINLEADGKIIPQVL